MVIDKSIKVSKSADDVMGSLIGAVKAFKASKAAGGSIPVDLFAGASAALSAVPEMASLPGDLQENKLAFERAVLASVPDLIDALVS